MSDSAQSQQLNQDPESGKGAAGGSVSSDYLGFSIFTCLCCFWCVGIPALVKSVAVRDANKRGDSGSAAASSREALLLNKIALGIGIAMHCIWILILIIVVSTGASILTGVFG